MAPSDHLWQVALALLGIIALVLILGAVAKRLQFGRWSRVQPEGALKIVDSAYLGAKERLVLVEVADRRVLLAMNPQCITKLSEFDSVDANTSFQATLDDVIEEAQVA